MTETPSRCPIAQPPPCARRGEGPFLLECLTHRLRGHYEGDPQRYRGPGEIARIRETRDCLKIFREQVTAKRWLKASELDQIDAEVDTLIEEAVTEARAAVRNPTAIAIASSSSSRRGGIAVPARRR